MDKLLTFEGTSDTGEQLIYNLFQEDATEHEKLAYASSLDPRVALHIRGISPSPEKLYVLVNALGAGEYYGSNINGDYFDEADLNPAAEALVGDRLFGFQTFYNSGVYRHHKNKDKTRSYGKVKFAVYNPRMHRVELIIEIDREKAEEFGHGMLVAQLDAGESPAVSMGCRVAFDVCSICHNKSRTQRDYCKHAKSMMNVTLPDGRKVFVRNPKPRFFDLSFVLIGADRSSFSMAKVAYSRAHKFAGLSTTAAFEAGLQAPEKQRLRSGLLEKMADRNKRAAIYKELPAVAHKVMPAVERRDPDIPHRALKGLSSKGSMQQILSSLMMSGTVLKPHEYQSLILNKVAPARAEQMAKAGHVFSPSAYVDQSVVLGTTSYQPEIVRALRVYIPGRTILGDELEKRASANPRRRVTVRNDALLEKIAEGYNFYRQELLEKMPKAVDSVSSRDPELLSIVFESVLEGSLSGTSKTAGVPSALLGVLPLAYLYGAHVRKSERAGEKPGVTDRFVERHPVLATSVMVGLARFGSNLTGTAKFRQLLASVVNKV